MDFLRKRAACGAQKSSQCFCSIFASRWHLTLTDEYEGILSQSQISPILVSLFLKHWKKNYWDINHLPYYTEHCYEVSQIILPTFYLLLTSSNLLVMIDFFFPTDGDRPRSFPESCGRQPAISCYVVCGIKLRCFPSLLAMPACMQSLHQKKVNWDEFSFFFLTNINYYFLQTRWEPS